MTDIVERLRDADPHEHGDNYQLCGDAADEIERLSAEGQKWMDLYGRVQEENERLRGALERISKIPLHHVGWRDIGQEVLDSVKEMKNE